MNTVIYLTPAELKLFDKLPVALRSEWQGKIVEEKGTAFETPKQLEMSVAMGRLSESPDMKKFRARLARQSKSGLSVVGVLKDFPQSEFANFIKAIGACGVCGLIEMAFLNGGVDDNLMQQIAGVSTMRHTILRKNLLLS